MYSINVLSCLRIRLLIRSGLFCFFFKGGGAIANGTIVLLISNRNVDF